MVEAQSKKSGTARSKVTATPVEQKIREAFFSQLKRDFKALYKFVRHQLAYLESIGDLIPGELSAEDAIDAVLMRAYHEYVKAPGEREFGHWLTQLADKEIQSQLTRLKSERENTVHIEEDIPETPPAEEVTTLGEEILYFFQPDEDLRLEDIFPEADVSTPEEWAAAKEELVRCINAALQSMPEEWRKAFKLRHVDRLTTDDLAEVLDKAEPEIEEMLEYARRHLREKLMASGCTFIVKGSPGAADQADAGDSGSASPPNQLPRTR
jgi:RNA polymerase sigma factor (sigma-70 family)